VRTTASEATYAPTAVTTNPSYRNAAESTCILMIASLATQLSLRPRQTGRRYLATLLIGVLSEPRNLSLHPISLKRPGQLPIDILDRRHAWRAEGPPRRLPFR